MNILVTAIGSMSADCVIHCLKRVADKIIGCDIYPAHWLMEAKSCDKFYQAPLAVEEEKYICFLMRVCDENNISYLIPLTDIEIDIINKYRNDFEMRHVTLCIPSSQTLEVARNKYNLYNEFKEDKNVPSIKTCLCNSEDIAAFTFPCIAKPLNGRSSEGLKCLNTVEELSYISDSGRYIIQEYKAGNVYTVDYVRCEQTRQDFAIAREELLRTKNGAGLTVRILDDSALHQLAAYVGRQLKINGCVNMEFIKKDSVFYLIDLNPRFSAGVAFSVGAGYDMVKNHLNCFIGKPIDPSISVKENIVTKQYKEIII